jgi:chemotaxis protein methyltransferase CheR
MSESAEPSYCMKEREFTRLSGLVYAECGINLAPAKRMMLSTRLMKRMRELRLDSFGDYYDYVTSSEGRQAELPHMIDVVSTNKTEFFREPAHYDYLEQVLLPRLAASGRQGRLKVWSAGCSSGEEPYTLAMILAGWVGRGVPDFSILATDISRRMLDRARRAVYPQEALKQVPQGLGRRSFLRGRGEQEGLLRVVPELRHRVEFRWLNLTEPFQDVEEMEVIFCRNVIIYFDRPTQAALMERFERQLAPGGHLFLGHSETLNGINGRLVPVHPTIYRRPA